MACSLTVKGLGDTLPLDSLTARAEKYIGVSLDSVLSYADRALTLAKNQDNPEALCDVFYFIHRAYYLENEMDSAAMYLDKAFALLPKLSNQEQQARIFHSLGIINYKTGELDTALFYYQKEYKLQEKMGRLQKVASALGNIGMVYSRQSKYQQSVDNYFQCLKIFQETNETNKIILTYTNIGNVYRFWEDYPKALLYYKKAIQLAEPDSANRFYGFINNNLAIVYRKQQKYDSAKIYYEKALRIYEQLDYPKGVASALTGLAITYNKRNDLEKSYATYHEAIKIQKTIHDQVGLASNYGNLGILSLDFSRPRQALMYLKKSDSIAKKIGYKEVQINNFETFRDAYIDLDDFEKALNYELQYVALRDSIYNLEKLSEIENIQEKYQAEQKQHRIDRLNEQARLKDLRLSRKNIFIGGLFIIILLILILTRQINRNYKARAKRRQVILENKLLRSQMNPHFMFNSLNAIQTYILQKNPLEGASYLSKFADLMRAILYNSREEFILLEKEINMIQNYLELQQIRFHGLFRFKVETEDAIDPQKIMIPPMLAQPFIENAIEHGFKNINYPGEMYISFEMQKAVMIITVRDNGIGVEASMREKKAGVKLHQSLATVISRERLDLFNTRMKKELFSLSIKQIKDTTEKSGGTEVKLKIPFRI